MNTKKILNKTGVVTPQEGLLTGGTYDDELMQKPYVPICVTNGIATIEESQEARRRFGFFISRILGNRLGLERAAISYEDLDPETGETLRDPQVLGGCNKLGNKIIPIEGRNLIGEARKIIKKWEQEDPEIKYFLREEESHIENEQPSSGGIESDP